MVGSRSFVDPAEISLVASSFATTSICDHVTPATQSRAHPEDVSIRPSALGVLDGVEGPEVDSGSGKEVKLLPNCGSCE